MQVGIRKQTATLPLAAVLTELEPGAVHWLPSMSVVVVVAVSHKPSSKVQESEIGRRTGLFSRFPKKSTTARHTVTYTLRWLSESPFCLRAYIRIHIHIYIFHSRRKACTRTNTGWNRHLVPNTEQNESRSVVGIHVKY